jgi:predicted CXXCH cytochrome family protein
MKKVLGLSVVLTVAPVCQAADIEAGKAKVVTVCAACHGATGVSVSDTIPNLAGQRAAYLEAQLKALKEGTRKNPIMNAIAAQLGPEEMANVAAYFASQSGAPSGAKSDFLPSVAKSYVTFPEGYKNTFTKYHTINFPATKQVRYFFANQTAVQAAKEGQPLPDGAVLFNETYAAKLDGDQKPVMGPDGFFVADKLLSYGAMSRGAGWGKDIPEMLRNGDWNYAVFTPDKQHKPGVNQAECLACHKPHESTSYTFTLKELAEAK